MRSALSPTVAGLLRSEFSSGLHRAPHGHAACVACTAAGSHLVADLRLGGSGLGSTQPAVHALLSRVPAWQGLPAVVLPGAELLRLVQCTLELLYGTIQTLIFSAALYFASGFARRADKFWWFTLFLWRAPPPPCPVSCCTTIGAKLTAHQVHSMGKAA